MYVTESTIKSLSPAERRAIEYIGSHRTGKNPARVGKGRPISTRTFNCLKSKGLVMWASESKKEAMLTYPGERVWSYLHPHSKYKVR